MYDLATSSVLFLLLTPGVIVTLPPSGGLMAALIHAIVFYVIQSYLASYIPWWGIWVAAVVVVSGKLWMNRTPSY